MPYTQTEVGRFRVILFGGGAQIHQNYLSVLCICDFFGLICYSMPNNRHVTTGWWRGFPWSLIRSFSVIPRFVRFKNKLLIREFQSPMKRHLLILKTVIRYFALQLLFVKIRITPRLVLSFFLNRIFVNSWNICSCFEIYTSPPCYQ